MAALLEDLQSTLVAPVFFGTFAMTSLFGVTTLKAHQYFLRHRHDSRSEKAFVVATWYLRFTRSEIRTQTFEGFSLLRISVYRSAFLTFKWAIAVQVDLVIIVLIFIHSLYGYMAWKLSCHAHYSVTYLVLFITLIGHGWRISALASSYTTDINLPLHKALGFKRAFPKQKPSGNAFIHQRRSHKLLAHGDPLKIFQSFGQAFGPTIIQPSYASSAIVDLVLAGFLCLILYKSRVEFPVSASKLSAIGHYVLASGLLVGILQLVAFITAVTIPENYLFYAIALTLPSVHALSYLSLLDARKEFRHGIRCATAPNMPFTIHIQTLTAVNTARASAGPNDEKHSAGNKNDQSSVLSLPSTVQLDSSRIQVEFSFSVTIKVPDIGKHWPDMQVRRQDKRLGMALCSLPEEILFQIFEHLPVEDLLNINTGGKTCKALNSICSSDALWRTVSAKAPLDIPLGKSTFDLKAGELRKLHTKAAKLAKFWTNDVFTITHVLDIPVDDWIHHAQFLSSQLLLTSHPIEEDGEYKTVLDIWSLVDRNPRSVLQIVTDRLFYEGIAAVWQTYGEALMLAVLTSQCDICVYTVSRCPATEVWSSERIWGPNQPFVATPAREKVCEIRAMQHIVATFTRDEEDRVWFFNSITKQTFYTQVPQYNRSQSPVLTLSHDLTYFVLTFSRYTPDHPHPEQSIQAFGIPAEIRSKEAQTYLTPKSFNSIAFACYTSPGFTPDDLTFQQLPYEVGLDMSNTLYLYQPHATDARAFIATFDIRPTEMAQVSSQIIKPRVSANAYIITAVTRHSVGLFAANVNGSIKAFKFTHLVDGGAIAMLPAEKISSRPTHALHIFAYSDTGGRICLLSMENSCGVVSRRLIVVDTI
ncbi:hypothetical protein ONZ45_g13138 [Pleurotus djamor]|nr:hypothetical protein ONZ45_g13138 [Pleurotus djamor]